MNPYWKFVLDPKTILAHTPSKKRLSVTLQKTRKGTSLVATKPIKRGRVVAYYKMMVFNSYTYRSPTKGIYLFTVYTKSEREIDRLLGDIYPCSVDAPKRNIPFWAHFSNEPSPGHEENCEIDINTRKNYKNRKRLKAGDVIVYKLRATKNIAAGEEITLCYGPTYSRDYSTSCRY